MPRLRFSPPGTATRTAAEVVSGHPVPATVETGREKCGKKDYGGMRPLVDQEALTDFLDNADAEDARHAALALEAMAAAARLAVVEIEGRPRPRWRAGGGETPARSTAVPGLT